MSAWGVVFLGLLGVFFYLQAVTLFPDLHFENEEDAIDNMYVQLLCFYSHFHCIEIVRNYAWCLQEGGTDVRREGSAMLDRRRNVSSNPSASVLAEQVQYDLRLLRMKKRSDPRHSDSLTHNE